jgi:Transposase IS116/IS110/IS902 family
MADKRVLGCELARVQSLCALIDERARDLGFAVELGEREARALEGADRLAGVAPIAVSSGRHDRHGLDRGGNRQLNRALHIIALTCGRPGPATREYLARKEAEGKSRMEAMRCLKRHVARHYHQLLLRPPAIRHNSPVIRGTAPMRCLT